MKNKHIDESLYSRQLYVLGAEAMQKMMNSNILIMGLDGLGQEVAKNVCLTGVKQVTLWDKNHVVVQDLCTGFYLSKSDIGKCRDIAVLNSLRKLNHHVLVDVADHVDEITKFDVVVMCNESYKEQILINNSTRLGKTAFISCQVSGLFSQIFCDFGPEFVCTDQNGEIASTGSINDLTEEGILTVVEGQRHNLEDGDVIKISHFEGKYFQVKSLSSTQVQLYAIDGVSLFQDLKPKLQKFKPAYGGDFEQQKRPKLLSFKALEDALKNPEILGVNFELRERAKIIHLCFIAMSEFCATNQQNVNDDSFYAFFVDKHQKYSEFENVIRAFGQQLGTTLMPMCSIVGGFVAQEVLKAVSSKFMPLCQFLYFDAAEILDSYISKNSRNVPLSSYNSRYEPLVRLFGIENFKKLQRLNIFLVGAGAIGCEHLKNLVMCGIGSRGRISVTDMDSIEHSNLSRQFLFRNKDVAKMKAEVAVKAVLTLNEDFEGDAQTNSNSDGGTFLKDSRLIDNEIMVANDTLPVVPAAAEKQGVQNDKTAECEKHKNLEYYNLKVGPETENVFHDKFFKSLDLVANALDNVEARLYIDNRCIINRKPLIDAGTSGTKGNVQVVIPFHTESYGSSRDPPEKSIPLCTIKNFPYAIEHTIEWAMSEFRHKFHGQILSIKDYLENGPKDDESDTDEDVTVKVTKLKESLSDVVEKAPASANECIKNAVLLFVKLFHTSIKNLLSAFPPDATTKEGAPFWMPPKRAPITINFDLNNEIHVLFVHAVANLFAYNFGINKKIKREEVVEFVGKEMLFVDYKTMDENKDEDYRLKAKKELLSMNTKPQKSATVCSCGKPCRSNVCINKLRVIDFEKDDDTNFHVDFIYACATLRGNNYSIKPTTKLAVKGIAGRIIPAIATTTSVVSGLAVLEMIKYALEVDNSKFRNSFLNLALPFFATTDPLEPEKFTYKIENKKYTFTIWNRIEYKDTKLGNILKAFELQFKKAITMVTIRNKLIYWDIDEKYKKNLEKTIAELVDVKENELFVVVDGLTDDDDNYPRMVVVYE